MGNFKPPYGARLNRDHPLSRGLVMALLMNEGSGNRTYDLTGNGNDGVLTNGPLWKPGRNGAAISFDGNNDYVGCGSGLTLQPSSGITYAVQIRPTVTGQHGIISSAGNWYERAYLYLRNQENRQIAFGVDDVSCFRTGNIINGRHAYIVGTYSKSTGAARLYQDTKIIGSGQWTGPIVTTADSLIIGYGPGIVAPQRFLGLISDVRIWNRALSPDEVQDLYINPYGFIYKPQKYWLMPQGVTIPPHLFRRVA